MSNRFGITEQELHPSLLEKIGGSGGNINFKVSSATVTTVVDKVAINIVGLDIKRDLLLVFRNGIILDYGKDYTITPNNEIVNLIEPNWDPAGDHLIFSFIALIKGNSSGGSDNTSNTIIARRNTVTISSSTSSINMNIPDYNAANDILMVYKNSTYIEIDRDYKLSSDGLSILPITGVWNPNNIEITFNFVVFKNIPEIDVLLHGNLIEDNSISINKLDSKVQVKILSQYITPFDFGAKGDGITDDTVAFRQALRLAYTNGSIRLKVPKATYIVDSYVDIYSNTIIEIEPGAVIKKSQNASTSYLFVCGRLANEGTPGYGGGAKNVRIDGGTFIGYPDNNIGISNSFNHMQDFEISNATFISAVSSGHAFDLAGCDNIKINNCTFKGWKYVEGRGFTEAIQIDNSTETALSGNFSNYDNLPTKNVFVDKCRFIPIYENDETTIKYSAPNAIGSHTYVPGYYFENINFTNNYVENVVRQGTGHSGGWIRFYAVHGLNIKNNIFNNTKDLNGYCISVQSKSINGEPILSCNNIDISNNVFSGFKYVGDGGYSIVRLYGERTEFGIFAEYITISNNLFKDCHPGADRKIENIGVDCINISNCKHITVYNNNTEVVKKLLKVYMSENIKVHHNTIKDAYYIPLHFDSVSGLIISENSFIQTGHAIYITTSNNIQIDTNNLQSVDFYIESFGSLIMAKTCKNLLVSNNVISRLLTDPEYTKPRVIHAYTDGMNQVFTNNICSGYNKSSTLNTITEVTTSYLGTVRIDEISKTKYPAIDEINQTVLNTLTYRIGTVGDSRTLGPVGLPKWQDIVKSKVSKISNWAGYGQSGKTFSDFDLGKIDRVCECYYVALGINDFRNSIPLDEFRTNMERVYDGLLSTKNNTFIIFQTPFKNSTWSTPNNINKTLLDYVNEMREYCDSKSIPLIDAFAESNINDDTFNIYLSDGLHLTEQGILLIGEYIGSKIHSLI